jgi:hypothetical protein
VNATRWEAEHKRQARVPACSYHNTRLGQEAGGHQCGWQRQHRSLQSSAVVAVKDLAEGREVVGWEMEVAAVEVVAAEAMVVVVEGAVAVGWGLVVVGVAGVALVKVEEASVRVVGAESLGRPTRQNYACSHESNSSMSATCGERTGRSD